MAINIKFDLNGNPEPPTIILHNRNGDKIGQLQIDEKTISLSDKLNDVSEFSFNLNKYIDGKLTHLWHDVVDFRLVYCKEWNECFEISVELDEKTETVKTVFCKQLGQAELSQIMLYNIEINTEKDIARDDYKNTILYDNVDAEKSLLNRLLEKAPHYSIAHVDSTIAKIQRTFSFDGNSIYDAFQDIAEEIGCLFVFHANFDENGDLKRTISVYDLQQNCNACGHRGDFLDKCPKCQSTNIKTGYGEDTLIFVTSDELASDGIQLTTDTASVKNCFKLEAGDDLITATVRNCNPNGTDYIWRFSDDFKKDMSIELVNKLDTYDKEYNYYYSDYTVNLDTNLLNNYNAIISKYSAYNKNLKPITNPIKGYSALMNAYYDTIDLGTYLKSSLMPSVEISKTNATEQASLLTVANLSPISVENERNASLATLNSVVLSLAKIIVKSTFKIQINSSELIVEGSEKKWKGNFVITNYSNGEDTAISNIITIDINEDYELFVKQKLDKILKKEDTDNLSISGLFKKEYNLFCAELKKYALNPLIGFRDACQTCIDILIEQGLGNKETWGDTTSGAESNLYEKLYVPYRQKLTAIESEIKIREHELNSILGVFDVDGILVSNGIQTLIKKNIKQIQNILNFEKYLGDKLWHEFCSFRREDKYSNENYISDGLNNAELFKKALEFFEVAKNEIYKASELQHSISTTLNNLLAIPKFKGLVKSFKTGNWIRVQIDEKVYKLRLLEYEIDFGDFENISVEFSDVIKIKNGITDVESILSQASSMASTYDSVKKQASQGGNAKGTIDKWLSDGLNASLVQIQNNQNEDIIIGKHGLLGRSYDEITGTYSPKQVKITHNTIAYTKDGWNSVELAIGENGYHVYDKITDSFVRKDGYGINASFVTSGVVNGSQIIGGDIYSDNYSVINKTGSYLNLRNGTFSFAGGALRYDGKKLIISSPDVPTTDQITQINEEYLKTTTVLAEKLKVSAANITGKLVIGQLANGTIPANVSDLNNDSGYQNAKQVTEITKSTVDTTYVNALKVTAGSVDAENITGTTITGKTIKSGFFIGGSIKSTNYNKGVNGTYIDLNNGSVEIGGGTLLYENSVLTLGKKDLSSVINLCGGVGQIAYVLDDVYGYDCLKIKGEAITLDTTNGVIELTNKMNQLSASWNNFLRVGSQSLDLVSICDARKKTASLTVCTSDSSYIDLTANDHIDIRLDSHDNTYFSGVHLEKYADNPNYNTVLRPYDSKVSLGSPAYKWYYIYASHSTIQTSDMREKENIVPLGIDQSTPSTVSGNYRQSDVHSELFDKLQPVQFNFINSDKRICYGLVAQQVSEAMKSLGINENELDLVHHDYWTDKKTGEKKDSYGLSYNNLIAMLIHEVQKLKIEKDDLKNRIGNLEKV